MMILAKCCCCTPTILPVSTSGWEGNNEGRKRYESPICFPTSTQSNRSSYVRYSLSIFFCIRVSLVVTSVHVQYISQVLPKFELNFKSLMLSHFLFLPPWILRNVYSHIHIQRACTHTHLPCHKGQGYRIISERKHQSALMQGMKHLVWITKPKKNLKWPVSLVLCFRQTI